MGIEQEHGIVLVSGQINAGKTSFCRSLAAAVRIQGKAVAGILSPGLWQDGEKVGVELHFLGGGQRLLLAHSQELLDGPTFGRFSFSRAAISAGNLHLRTLQNIPLDLLILDEIGPLECQLDGGLQQVWPLLQSGRYRLAVITTRPRLLSCWQERFPKAILGVIMINDKPLLTLFNQLTALTGMQIK